MYNICNVDVIYEFHRLFPVGGGCNAQLSSINDRLAEIENFLWPPQQAGDIVYYKDILKTINYRDWNNSLGTPVGVITIPAGFAPDGKARMVALSGVTSGGTVSSSVSKMKWANILASSSDTSLKNYTKVPTTDNAGSTSSGSNGSGYLPSNTFGGATSYVDSVAKYFGLTPMIPSPYAGDAANPEYYKAISGNNALSDFNGLNNTQTLVGLGTSYTAANACWNYSDGVSTTRWYLPAMGELGYMMLRFNEINAGLAKVNAVQLGSSNFYWSSSEYSSKNAYYVNSTNGYVGNYDKGTNYYALPWAVVE